MKLWPWIRIECGTSKWQIHGLYQTWMACLEHRSPPEWSTFLTLSCNKDFACADTYSSSLDVNAQRHLGASCKHALLPQLRYMQLRQEAKVSQSRGSCPFDGARFPLKNARRAKAGFLLVQEPDLFGPGRISGSPSSRRSQANMLIRHPKNHLPIRSGTHIIARIPLHHARLALPRQAAHRAQMLRLDLHLALRVPDDGVLVIAGPSDQETPIGCEAHIPLAT